MKYKNYLRILPLLLVIILGATLGESVKASTIQMASIPPALKFTPIASGLTQPLFVTHAGDGSNRIFIVERGGTIRILKNGGLLPVPFLDVHTLLTTTGGEQGLLGLAFHPDYKNNRHFFISYTDLSGAITLARYQASLSDPDLVKTSGNVLLTIPKTHANHNGGMLAFFPLDGYLYMSTGDGGGAGDPDNNAQDRTRLLGKILRLDVDSASPYAIPATNPYYNNLDPQIKQEIWAYGLRNPWRFSFDSKTGDLYIGDVGQNTEEEVDFQPFNSSGDNNYGWSILEGNLCFKPAVNCVQPSNYVPPVAVYDHGTNDSYGCSVTGGYVYRGNGSPSLKGTYFYGDFCTGKIFGLYRKINNTWMSKLVISMDYRISSFGEDEQGELYLTDYTGGRVMKISEINLAPATFLSEGDMDGSLIETSEFSGVGGYVDPVGKTFRVGDNAVDRQIRVILPFNTAALPYNAVIVSARVKIKRSSITGVDPFSTHGKLLLDLGVPYFGTSATLESLDFQAPAVRYRVAGFNPVSNFGWYTASFNQASLVNINLAGMTQLRLRFDLDDNDNAVADSVAFFSGDAVNSANVPVLIIQYYIP